MTDMGDTPEIPIGTIMHFFDIDSVVTSITTRTTDLEVVLSNGKGWYICNGQTTTDLENNLTLPDLIGDNRFLRGNSTQGNLTAGIGGAETVTLVTAELPVHHHHWTKSSLYSNAIGQSDMQVDRMWWASYTPSSNYTGGGGSHNNMPPYRDVMFIIKMK